MKQPELKLFGTFRSGSNLVRTLLQTNFDVKVHNNTYAYKHLTVPANYKDSRYQPFPYNIVGTVKDPFAFLDSAFRYCQKNNYLNIDAGRTFDEFIRQSFVVFDGGFKNFPRYRFANPVQYWNSINMNLLSLPKNQCSIIRYESLLVDMKGEIEKIAKHFELNRTTKRFIKPRGITKNLGDQQITSPKDYVTGDLFERGNYYLQREYMQEFTDSQMDFVFSELDLDVARALSYSPSSSISKNESAKFDFVENIRSLVELNRKNTSILEAKLEEEQFKNNHLVKTLESEIEELHEEVAGLHKSTQEYQGQVNTLESRLEEKNLQHKLSLELEKQKFKRLEIERENLEHELEHLELNLKINEQQNKKLGNSLGDLKQQFSRQTDLILDLQGKETVRNRVIADLNSELHQANEEVGRLSAAFRRASNNYYDIKRSFSFQFGHDFVHAIIKPGRNTILFPFRTIKNIFSILKNKNKTTKNEADGQPGNSLSAEGPASTSFPAITPGAAPKEQHELTIASIFDEFTTQSYRHECNLVPVPLNDWEDKLSSVEPDLLMVESAWKGSNGQWEFKIGTYADQDHGELKDLVGWCKERLIPTVFWNKEDPIHFDKFIDAAKLFDVVFTTDANLIPKYKKAVGHERVYSLQFSAQPRLHNPIHKYRKENKICFAGSYYANRHEDRRKDMDEILDIAKEFDLVIYDRNHEKNLAGETAFSFPERFRQNIIGSLPYNEIDKAYKGYDFILNVNSVKNSPTMFSRRVFEGIACGTPVLSTYSIGVKKTFRDLVLIAETGDELRPLVHALNEDRSLYEQKSVQGIREIFSKHLYRHRLQRVLQKAGIKTREPRSQSVTLFCIVDSETDIQKAIEIQRTQSWTDTKLCILLQDDATADKMINRYNTQSISVMHLPSILSLETTVNDYVTTEFIAFLNPTNIYGKHFLLDLVQATAYAEADIYGKNAFYTLSDSEIMLIEGTENNYSIQLGMDSSIIRSALLRDYRLENALAILTSAQPANELFGDDVRGFSINRFNFVKSENLGDSEELSDKISSTMI